MLNNIFLTCFEKGVTRAEQNENGSWLVRHLIPDLPVTCLAADPANSQVIYAGTKEQGVWRSNDGGLTWQLSGLEGQSIKSLAISPHNSNIMYAGTKPALMFISRDGAL